MKIPETTLNDIDREVSETVEQNKNDRVDVVYLVNTIVSNHESIKGDAMNAEQKLASSLKILVTELSDDHKREAINLATKDADYAALCIYVTVRDRVEVYVRRTKKSEKKKRLGVVEETLLGLEGYVHLQERYVINGTLVKLDAMSDDEFTQKIEEHYAQGDGHYAHGAELARYQTELRAALSTK